MSRNEVVQTRLRNGLEVRLKPIHTAPLISTWLWYRVGSRSERPGNTGISHWVEHMQFKGTPTFPAGILDRAISRDGGYWNAFTWLDWTAYFETMPAGRVDLALQLEADRMVNSQFAPKEVASERTVIISERQGYENNPTFRLAEEVQAAAFRVNAYHHEVIGDLADLQTIQRQDLYEHYQRYYVPGNAVLAIAGDFGVRSMLDRVRAMFGELLNRPRPEIAVRNEPEQRGERRVSVEGPDETPYLEVAYRAPNATDPAFIKLVVLNSVLAGASNLSLIGGGISNKTSRLYRRLVEGELAASLRGSLTPTLDPYLYTIRVTVRPDRTPEQALQALDDEIDELLQQPVEIAALEKAIKQARALFAYGSESISNQAMWLGYSEMFADYSWFESYLDRMSQVTPEEILETARTWLLPGRRVVGIYRPTGAKS